MAICIVTFKNEKDISGLIESLSNTEYPKDKVHVFIADNNSEDDTARLMNEKVDKLPFSSLFNQNKSNIGFDQANNKLVNRAVKNDPTYIVLLNPDTVVHKKWLKELVAEMELHPEAGVAQSLLLLKSDPLKINTKGNALYFLGLGYITGLYSSAKNVYNKQSHEIGYSSGAASCYRVKVLKRTGLFYPDFFYLEDLDLSWRMKLLGYTSILCPKSIVWHDYTFSKGAYKMKAIELSRYKVLLQNYRLPTLLLLLPALIFFEILVILGSIKEGWYKEKFKNYSELIKSIKIIRKRREIIQKNRKTKDRTLLNSMVLTLQFPEGTPFLIRYFLNPVIVTYGWIIRSVVWW